MKKITILALHLGYGGIERCISSLANALSDKYEVEIISTYKLYDKPAFDIKENVGIKYLMSEKPNKEEIKDSLRKLRLITLFKELVKALKILKKKKNLMVEEIKKCNSEIIISTRDIHNLWLGTYGPKKAIKIGWEHNDHNNNQKYINKIIKSIENLDYFVLVSKELRDFYQSQTNTKCIYIPNTLDYYPKRVSELDNHNLISVGRLSKEKGFVDLIDVMKLVIQKYPDTILNIIGDGVELENIEERIKQNLLSDNIKLHGFKDRNYINELLSKSSVYVMPSYTESFGIVLLEAFAFGIPCVAFDSARGAREIIDNNWDGYLISNRDKEAMARKICELLANQNRRIIMGANAIKKADKYNIDIIKEEWIKLIEEKI